MAYKEKLLDELVRDDWKRLECIRAEAGWTADEYWKMQSVREQWATEIFIGFIVDPVWDAPLQDGQNLRQIIAYSHLPDQHNNDATQIASLDLSENFDSKLMPFIYGLYISTQTVRR